MNKMRDYETNPKKTWEMINEITDTKAIRKDIKEIKADGKTFNKNNLKEMADAFNN